MLAVARDSTFIFLSFSLFLVSRNEIKSEWKNSFPFPLSSFSIWPQTLPSFPLRIRGFFVSPPPTLAPILAKTAVSRSLHIIRPRCLALLTIEASRSFTHERLGNIIRREAKADSHRPTFRGGGPPFLSGPKTFPFLGPTIPFGKKPDQWVGVTVKRQFPSIPYASYESEENASRKICPRRV